MPTPVRLRYTTPIAGGSLVKYLVADAGTERERRFAFHDTLEIGRYESARIETPGLLLVDDSTVSFRHCVITQRPDGRCTVRDLSRNGTRVDGRRIVPNVETAVTIGQSIEVAAGQSFVMLGEESERVAPPDQGGRTEGAPNFTIVTVLVGDIGDYTAMVRQASPVELQQSVGRVFERLTKEVVRCGGTVKEYQGDAIFAFWEGAVDGDQAARACAAALALNRLANQLAEDSAVWQVAGFPLKMDWALATGPVVIDSMGSTNHRAGLSMIGEAVVLAFRLEKFASPETGPILACEITCKRASGSFTFRSLGEMRAKGFDRDDRVFALVG